MQIFDGENKLTIETSKKQLVAHLLPGQFNVDTAGVNPALAGSSLMLAGQVQTASVDELVLTYALPKGAQSLTAAAAKRGEAQRIALALALSPLVDTQTMNVHPFMHPDNLVVLGTQIKVAHRGLHAFMMPEAVTPERLLRQYQALVATVLNPRLDYERLVDGQAAISAGFTKKLFECDTPIAVQTLLAARYQELMQGRQLVRTGLYKLFTWASVALGVAVLALIGWLVFLNTHTVPLQSRVITAQGDFIGKDYDGVTKALADDSAKSLPTNAQYVLAASYVHVDSLTPKQKQAILNNLSPKSDDNVLRYWIGIGRGDLQDALSLAKNVGDDQLILYAYTKLYAATQADTQMPGAKKQDALAKYQKQINEYVKKLGGKTNGIEQ